MTTHPLAAATMPAIGRTLAVLAERIALWVQLWAERRRLGELDEHARRDLGLTEGVALRESSRPFWDAPAYR
jgi:uncharacterized protein YjiS (DUF1127 family)